MGYPITHQKPALKYGDSTADRFIHSEPMLVWQRKRHPRQVCETPPHIRGSLTLFFNLQGIK